MSAATTERARADAPARPRDWQGAIQQSGLPEPLRVHVGDVVRRTRLWRRERLDVALELIAHFHDGLEAGRDAGELRTAFGETRRTARLIRRAAKRKRAIWWQAWSLTLRSVGIGIVALIAVYLVLFVRFHAGRPSPSTDYLAAINARAAALAPEDRAWPLYERAFGRIGTPGSLETPSWAGPIRIDEVGPGNPLHAEAMAYLREARTSLDLVREGASRRGMGLELAHAAVPPGSASDERASLLLDFMLPPLGSARAVARLLAYEARHGALEGDADLVHANILAILGLARHMREHPFLISDLVAFAIANLGCELVTRTIADHPALLTREQLVSIAHALASWDDGYPRLQLAGERYWFEDFVQHIYTDDGSGGGRLTRKGIRLIEELENGPPMPGETSRYASGVVTAVGPLASVVVAGRGEMVRMYNEMMREMERFADRGMWTWDELENTAERVHNWIGFQSMRYQPISIIFPAIDRGAEAAHLAQTRRDAAALAVVLELYRREHGELPERLDQLVPRFMPSLPLDPFDGRPLRYALRDGVAHVWSIGADRKDDSGRSPAADREPYAVVAWVPIDLVPERLNDPARARGFDGDWLLLPPRPWTFISENDPRMMQVLGMEEDDGEDDRWIDEAQDHP